MKKLFLQEAELIAKQKYALVDFYAEWCGPCKFLGPELEKAEPEILSMGVVGYKIDIDECSELAIRNKVQYVPTVIFFKEGVEQDRFVGAISKDEVIEFVRKNI